MIIKEKGAIIKKGRAALSIALGYPDTYYVGMSSLGYQSIYKIFNLDGRVVCERFFIDNKLTHPLRTIESKRKVSSFNVIAFSIAYELNIVNIIKALHLAGLNPRAKERNDYDPLVIAGGAYASINPLPLTEFCDVICIGDGEVISQKVINVMLSSKCKNEVLEKFNTLDGFLVSKFFKKWKTNVNPAFINKNLFSVLHSQIITNHTEFANTHLIEIMRGCPWQCNFCWIGSFYKPCKIHPLNKIIDSFININYENTKETQPSIGLIAASSSDHPQFVQIVENINKLGFKKVSFSSLRCSNIDNSYLEIIKKNNIKSLTLAPETASTKLQKLINKQININEFIELCKNLAEAKVKYLKLYFMMGLPDETDADLIQSVNLIELINGVIKNYGAKLNISFNYLVPKPFTKFQYLPMYEYKTLVAKAALIQKYLKKIKGLNYKIMKPELAFLEAVLSLSDERCIPLLEKLYKNEDSWRVIVRNELDNYSNLLFKADKNLRSIHTQTISLSKISSQ
jgi:radical SAM superfamily enzyme YgiQ (UPF0313 family)